MIKKIIKLFEHYTFFELLNSAIKMFIRKRKQNVLKTLVNSGKVFNVNLIDPDIPKNGNLILKLKGLNFSNNLIKTKIHGIFENERSNILKEANLYINNKFNILGSGWVSWIDGDKIAWQRDIKSGYNWDADTYYLEISKRLKKNISKSESLKVDIKVPRELSRFYFIFTLYAAYILTNEEQYLEKIKETILCWIKDNPPFYGVNWSNAMEAAIRITNWSLIIYALKEILVKDNTFMLKFYTSLHQHLLYIIANLENVVHTNNHYLSNVVGVYVVNTLFPIFKDSKKWQKWAKKEIKKEFKYQVYDDGGNFESSSSYHRLAIELFFLPQYLSEQLGQSLLNDNEKKKLENMFFQIKNTIKANGENIQFGDNDDGQYFKLFERDALHQAYLISLGFGLFNSSDRLVRKDIPFDMLSYVFFGEDILQQYKHFSNSVKGLKSEGFTDSGVYILRSELLSVAVSCMPNGQYGKGIHTHNDKLSFELNHGEMNIIVDPGTYCYTSDPLVRNRFRSTRYHNTVMEGNYEQNDLGDTIFILYDQAEVKVNRFSNDELNCQHNGFEKKGGTIHKRKFKLSGKQLHIIDYLENDHPSAAFFHFAEDILPQIDKEDIVIKKNDKVLFNLIIENSTKVYTEDYEYSPSYGKIILCKKLIVEFKGNLKSTFILKK